MVSSRKVEIPFYSGIGQQCGCGFGALAQAFEKTAISFLRQIISSQLKNTWVLSCWNSMGQNLQRLLVVEKISRQLQKVWENRL